MKKKLSTLALFVATVSATSITYALNAEMKSGTILRGILMSDMISKSMDDQKSVVIRVGGSSCVVNAQGSLYPTGRIHIGVSDITCNKGSSEKSTKLFGYIFDPRTKATGMISECLKYRKTKNSNPDRPGLCIEAKVKEKTPVLIKLTQAAKLK